jgi:D-alanine--D-alanine ligase
MASTGQRIGIIYNLKNSALQDDSEAEFDKIETIQAIAAALSTLGHHPILMEANHQLYARLTQENIAIALNIAEGRHGRSREALVPAFLESLEIEFTGSDAVTLGIVHDKVLAKRLVRDAGFRTPEFAILTSEHSPLPAALQNHWPLMVKPIAEGSSKGITEKSVAHHLEELQAAVKHITHTYHQPALVERFLNGREFTIGIIGTPPIILPILEIEYTPLAGPHPIYGFEQKQSFHPHNHHQVPAHISLSLQEALHTLVKGAWEVLGCRDIARIDIRCDDNDQPYFLECNALPGLTPEWSDFALMTKALDWDYTRLIAELLAPALQRYHQRRAFSQA